MRGAVYMRIPFEPVRKEHVDTGALARPVKQSSTGPLVEQSSYYRDSVPASSQSATSASKTSPSLHQFFAPAGLLSRTHPSYEFRRGQLQMAQAVEQAIAERRHLIVEAGTGT